MRWKALDELRGLSMVLLVILSPLFLFDSVPLWLKHSPHAGFQLADAVAPMFLFAIGLSYELSLRRRLEKSSLMRTALTFAKRYGIFIVFGLLGEVARYRDFTFAHWGMLESIGVCGIAAFPCMFLAIPLRILGAFIFLGIWQTMLALGYAPVAMSYDLGGPFAVLAWSPIILFASAVSLAHARFDRKSFLMLLALVIAAASALAYGLGNFVHADKHLVTATYIMAGIACASAVLFFFECAAAMGVSFRTSSLFGKNSLLMYFLAGFGILAIQQFVPKSLPFQYALLIALGLFALCRITAWSLDRKKIYLKM